MYLRLCTNLIFVMALEMLQGEHVDPLLKKKKEKGRKATVKKALEGKKESGPQSNKN